MDAFRPSGVITLMTDFGLGDPFVGVMKGVILGRHANARIVDLTHAIQPYSPREAGFWLSRSLAYFPDGTVHVCVVDPGVGTARNILVVQAGGQVCLAPDNGLLTSVIRAVEKPRVHRLDAAVIQRFSLPVVSATFHGRDIFAPIAAELACAQCRPEELGPAIADWIADHDAEPLVSSAEVQGVVITIDRFGNLISNIEGKYLDSFRQPVVRAADRMFPMRRTYGDGKPGECLALVNAFGVVELAQVQGSAEKALRLERGAAVELGEA